MGYARELARKGIGSIIEAEPSLSIAETIEIYERMLFRMRSLKLKLVGEPFRFVFGENPYRVYITTDCEWNLIFLVGRFGKNEVIELREESDGRVHRTRETFCDRMDENALAELMRSTEEVDDLPGELDGMYATLLEQIH